MRHLAEEKVVRFLKERGKACTLELVNEMDLSWVEALNTLSRLERGGLIRRVEVLDPTKPLATAVWEAKEKEKAEQSKVEELGTVVGLILNPPLLRDLKNTPPASMGLLDSLSYIVNSTSSELRISMPYVGGLISTLFTQHLQELRKLKTLRVITEETQDNKRSLEPLSLFLPNLRVRYATRRINGIKVAGAHLKLIIADDKMAIVGTFNLTQAHLLVNYDIGLLVRGNIVRHLCLVFDTIWDALSGVVNE